MSYEVEEKQGDSQSTWMEKVKESRLKKKKDWTIMVYLGGDNNLAEEMVYSLKSMFNVGSTKDIAIFAYFDAGLDPVRFPIDTRKDRRERLGQKIVEVPASDGPVTEDHSLLTYREKLVKKGPVEVKSVQSTLEEFLLNCICDMPAQHYMLVLSGHGSGSVGDFLGARKRSSGLTIPDLSETLRNVTECFKDASAARVYQRMDILGLDSCQMSTAEVAFQVRTYVSYLVGAEGFEPNTGWPYDRMLDSLKKAVGQAEKISQAAMEAINGALEEGRNPGPRDAYVAAEAKAKEIFSKFGDGMSWQKFDRETVMSLAERGALQLIKDRTIEQLTNEFHKLKRGQEPSKQHDDEIMDGAFSFAMKEAERFFPKDLIESKRNSLKESAEDAVLELFAEDLSEATLGRIPPDEETLVFPPPRLLAEGIVRQYTHFYSTDYTLADVSTDVSALDLSKMEALVGLLRKSNGLTDLMTLSLKSAYDPARAYFSEANPPYLDINDAILLAHWESQGYKDEQNVDLWDFCDRLRIRCDRIGKRSQLAKDIAAACGEVQRSVTDPKNQQCLVVRSGYCGPAFQHSHGLSVYFPWSDSTDAAGLSDLAHYRTLEFPFGARWDDFLEAYMEVTRREGRITAGEEHESTLNRRDGFFLGEPDEGVLNLNVDVSVQDGQIIVRDADLVLKESELVLENYNQLVFRGDEHGQLFVRDGEISLISGTLTVTESDPSKATSIDVEYGEKLSARDGRLSVRNGRLTVRDGRLSVRDGRLSVRDGRLSVRGEFAVYNNEQVLKDGDELIVRDGRLSVRGDLASLHEGEITVRDGRLSVRGKEVQLKDKQKLAVRDGRLILQGETVRDGRLSVRDGRLSVRDMKALGGRLTIRDGRLSVRDGRLSVRDMPPVLLGDGEELTVRDGRLSVRGESSTVLDGNLTVRDGRLSVRNGNQEEEILLRDGEGLSVRDGRLSVRGQQLDVRDGRLSVRDGRLSVRGDEPNIKDGRLSVRDGRLSVRGGGYTVRDGRLSVRGEGQTSVRDGRLSVRDGRLSVRDGRLSVRDGRLSVRGGLALVIKIASMKNPPTVWRDCDLMASDE